jgi:hypothetical protein
MRGASATIIFLHNLALFGVKNDNFFAKFFVENIFKIVTSVPGVIYAFVGSGLFTFGFGIEMASSAWPDFPLVVAESPLL